MTPERLSDEINSYSTDQYSLGVSLYELATRSLVLPQTCPRELIQRICSAPLPPIQCAESDLAAIINKSISFRPEDRYESMDKMASDLRRFLNHEPVSAAQTSFRRRLSLWTKRNRGRRRFSGRVTHIQSQNGCIQRPNTSFSENDYHFS